MGKQKTSGEVASEYCRRYPSTPNLQLARMMHRDQPVVFANVDAARSAVRYYRGAHGSKDREGAERTGVHIERVALPEPEPPQFSPYILPGGIRRWLIVADAHVPYHDGRALRTVLGYATAKETRCDGILYLGDMADCYSLSFWLKDPRLRRFPEEVGAVKQTLDAFNARIKPKHVVYKVGNHEHRLIQYLRSRAPELLGIDRFEFRNVMGLDSDAIDVVDSHNPIRCRALTLLHGHEWRMGATLLVNPARTAYLRAKACALIGHHHRSSEHTEQDVAGITVTCWSIGCLCDTHPEYSPLNNWNLGFATLEITDTWRITNRRIVNGEVV